MHYANAMQDDDTRTSKRATGNPLYLGLTAKARPNPPAAATAAPTSFTVTAAAEMPASSPLSLTFREHMDTARRRWTMQAQRSAREVNQQPMERRQTMRPASAVHSTPNAAENGFERSIAATIAPSPPVRPVSSYTHKRNTTAVAAASARPASAFSHAQSRPSPPVTAPAAASASATALPLRATNLTHVAKAGVPYAGELFHPFGRSADPFDAQGTQQDLDEWEESKDNSNASSGGSALSSSRHASLYRHRPLRYYRGWVKCVPPRDDAEEERIYSRNVSRGIVPPLKTITAQAIRHQPITTVHGGTARTQHAPRGVNSTQQRPKSAVESSFRLQQQQQQQQQQQAQHVAAVLASNALLAARWSSQPHMSHTEINPPFAPLSTTSAVDRGSDPRDRLHAAPLPPPPLLDDKNEFDAQRLLRAPRPSGAMTTTTASAATASGGGLEHELACNAAPPAGRLNPSAFTLGASGASREFSALFPASADFGGPVPGGLYVSESALRFGPIDPRRVRINLAQATRGPGARVVEMDARSRANHQMSALMRGNYHQQSKLKKDKNGRAF